MPTTTRKPAKKTGTKKPKTTKKTKKTKKTSSKTKKPRSRTVTREVIREVPVFYTNTNVPFMPFRALDTGLAQRNLLGYMRGLIDVRNPPMLPPINPLLVPTNTRRSMRKSAPARLRGDRGVAQEIVNDHFRRSSRLNDTHTSVFNDLQRDLGVYPRTVAL